MLRISSLLLIRYLWHFFRLAWADVHSSSLVAPAFASIVEILQIAPQEALRRSVTLAIYQKISVRAHILFFVDGAQTHF